MAITTTTTTARMARVVEVTICDRGGEGPTALKKTETRKTSRLGARTGARGKGLGLPSL
jgi:hypothetical protein